MKTFSFISTRAQTLQLPEILIRHSRLADKIKALPAFLSLILIPLSVYGQEPELAGAWQFNEELSDSTDKQVEVALKAAGEKIQRKFFDRRKDKYRGGPADQELYDHISYDQTLSINLDGDVFQFIYDDQFTRPVYTDNRSRSISLTGLDEIEDFSFGHWEAGVLFVEARPRDGGFADETYTLINGGTRLKVDLYIKPRTFQVPIELTRIYDRAVTSE